METVDFILLFLITISFLLFLGVLGRTYNRDQNDDGKENYRRGWRHWDRWGPGWGRRRNWIW